MFGFALKSMHFRCVRDHLQQQRGATELAKEGDPGGGAEVQAVLQVHEAAQARAPLHIPDHGLWAAASNVHNQPTNTGSTTSTSSSCIQEVGFLCNALLRVLLHTSTSFCKEVDVFTITSCEDVGAPDEGGVMLGRPKSIALRHLQHVHRRRCQPAVAAPLAAAPCRLRPHLQTCTTRLCLCSPHLSTPVF